MHVRRFRAALLAALGMLTVCAPAFTIAQAITDAGKAQIAALLREKDGRTADERKVDSNLVAAARVLAARGLGPALPAPEFVQRFIDARVTADGLIEVTIDAPVSDDLVAALAMSGGRDVRAFPRFGRLTARLPAEALLEIAHRGDVRHVRPLVKGLTRVVRASEARSPDRKALRDKVAAAIGVAVSEGVAAHGVDQVHSAGIDGSGVTVCVISDGVDSIAARQASGDLPPNIDILDGQMGTGDEGTAMLEIIHDLAPGAALAFATGVSSEPQMAQNILDLQSAHACDIQVDDVGFPIEGVFQDGPIAIAANYVASQGALYVSAAGNDGNLSHVSSGTWEGDWADSGYVLDSRPVQAFDGAPANILTLPHRFIFLSWSDPLGSASNDYDLFVLDPSGNNVVAASYSVQSGVGDPLELIDCAIQYCPSGGLIVVMKSAGSARALHLGTWGGRLSVATSGASFGHPVTTGALAVAAVNVATAGGGAFAGGPSNPTESFSSDGPRKLFYDSNGVAVTGGNVLFATDGGVTLAKVDLAAADGVSTSTPDYSAFYGTSAAAPHVAAIAALVKSANPGTPLPLLKSALDASALDIEAVGFDRDSGAGIVMAPAAVRAVLAPLVGGKSFTPATIPRGGTATLAVTLFNPNAVPLIGTAFIDSYPPSVLNADSPNAQIGGAGCDGALDASPGGASIQLTSGVVPAGATCTISVQVTSSSLGDHMDDSGDVTTLIGITTPAAPATLAVAATVPGSPTGVTASAGNAQATVSFTAPIDDGGSAVTGYLVKSNPQGGTDADAGSTSTTHTVTGLTNGVAYTFSVQASNAVGPSAPSAPSNSVTPSTVPDPPTAVTAVGGDGLAIVSFTAGSDGGSPILGYSVASIPSGGTDADAGSTADTHTVFGLTNGTPYTFVVTATNARGTSAPSLPSNSVTPEASAAPSLVKVRSRSIHGAAGAFDLALNRSQAAPTIEPRTGGLDGSHTVVFTFNRAVTGGDASVVAGAATVGTPSFIGNEMIVPLSNVADQQYVTVEVGNVTAEDGGTGGIGAVRIGFLKGDVTQSRAVSLADMLSVNAVLAQSTNSANFLRDLNASGSVTLSDKLVVNAMLTHTLPAP